MYTHVHMYLAWTNPKTPCKQNRGSKLHVENIRIDVIDARRGPIVQTIVRPNNTAANSQRPAGGRVSMCIPSFDQSDMEKGWQTLCRMQFISGGAKLSERKDVASYRKKVRTMIAGAVR